MGSFRIIETTTSRPACIARYIPRRWGARRSALCLMLVVLLDLAACVVPAAAATPGAARTGQMAQYQGLAGRQYHEIAPASEATSPWLRETRQLQGAISSRVISRVFPSRLQNSRPPAVVPLNHSIDAQIAPRNGRDPSVLLRIGAALGLAYLAFLAVWFWATRARRSPPPGKSLDRGV